MHYKNGREAKNGDKIIMMVPKGHYGESKVGILYDAVAGNDCCNGKVATISTNDPMPNLKDCLHIDDAISFLSTLGIPENVNPSENK